MIKNNGWHLSSAKAKPIIDGKTIIIKDNGTATISVTSSPAVTTPKDFSFKPCARYLVMIRDTVDGIPALQIVKTVAKTDSAIWYKPMPSLPIVLDKNILYKKPKNFSNTEKNVTVNAVLKTVFILTFY